MAVAGIAVFFIKGRKATLPKVMIIDDDQTTSGLLEMLLTMDGFEVATLVRGKEALNRAREERPDIFMIDRHLADMDGFDVIRTLRDDPDFAETPIVMASGRNVEDEALQVGATMFLIKPLEPETLADTLKTLL